MTKKPRPREVPKKWKAGVTYTRNSTAKTGGGAVRSESGGYPVLCCRAKKLDLQPSYVFFKSMVQNSPQLPTVRGMFKGMCSRSCRIKWQAVRPVGSRFP